jgi:hypothetical protein
MNKDITVIMNGFFKLPNLDKLKVVEAINEYFDSNDRGPIRAEWEKAFATIDRKDGGCICCEN